MKNSCFQVPLRKLSEHKGSHTSNWKSPKHAVEQLMCFCPLLFRNKTAMKPDAKALTNKQFSLPQALPALKNKSLLRDKMSSKIEK